MAFNCLTGCVRSFHRIGIRQAINEAVLMPWVEVRISGADGVAVSVGNFSSRERKAVIKSFQFGISNGNGCTIEVLDEEGGEFSTFYEKISTGNLDSGTRSFVLDFEFGWATMSCEDGGSTINQQHCCPTGPLVPTLVGFGSPPLGPFNPLDGLGLGGGIPLPAVAVRPSGTRQGLRSCRHTMTVRNIICNVANGVFKYSIEGADMTTDMFSTRSPETFGRDTVGGEMYLTDAIRSLFREFNVDVDFFRLEGTCRPEPMRWRVTRPGPPPPSVDEQATRGPLGRWSALNRNPIQASRAWLSEHLTDRNKGIVTFWDTTKLFRPRLIFLEANDLSCFDVRDTLQFHVGTYIVNGGACLEGYSHVLTEHGWNYIGHLVKHKYSGKVACIDENNNLTWSNVVNWYRNKRENRRLIKVRLHHNRQRARSVSGAILTEDHLVLTKRGYIPTSSLDISTDLIHSGTTMPSNDVHEAIIGILLGDGSIRKNHFNFECTHCVQQLDYIKHKSEILGESFKLKKNGYGVVRTKASPYWRKMRKRFYPDGIKRITEDCLDGFTEVSLAYLFMDDGSLDKRKLRASIAICSFSDEEVDLLVNKINSLGFKCYKVGRKYKRIDFMKKDTMLLSQKIAQYVLPELAYKLLPEHRHLCGSNMVKFGVQPFYDTFDLIRCIDKENKTKTVYCLDVEKYHNFITHSGVVHNCSPVLSFTPQLEYVPNSLGVGTGGAGGGATMPTMFRETGPEPCLRGSPSMRFQGYHNPGFVETHTAFTSYGRDGIREASDAKLIHARANLYANRGITAELRVQGDPSFDTPLLMHGHYVSIVYINPFRVKPQRMDGKDYCDWVSRSSCSNMLSNSNYMITGVSHEIKEGHFSTTLKLRLATPGIDIGRDLPIGGMPGGPTIPRT